MNKPALTSLAAASLLALSSPASARTFGIRGTSMMAVRGIADAAVRLQPGVAGWYLALDVPNDASTCRAELRDVSPLPGPLLKWVEEVPNFGPTTTVPLTPARYVGSHTYHLTLRCGLRELGHGLVHLVAPADSRIQQRFQVEQSRSHEDAGEIAIVPKGAL